MSTPISKFNARSLSEFSSLEGRVLMSRICQERQVLQICNTCWRGLYAERVGPCIGRLVSLSVSVRLPLATCVRNTTPLRSGLNHERLCCYTNVRIIAAPQLMPLRVMNELTSMEELQRRLREAEKRAEEAEKERQEERRRAEREQQRAEALEQQTQPTTLDE